MTWSFLRRTSVLAALFCLASAPASAAEQLVLEEIVVTATRRAETDMQSTPVAVSVVSTEEFENLFWLFAVELLTSKLRRA